VNDTARPTASTVTALVAAVAALGVSIYLTIEHYDHGTALACPESATINCLKVTTSKWSVVAGVPVAVAGLAYFVVMVGILVTALRYRGLETLALVGAVIGLGSAFYLVGVELFAVDAICLWCTAVHVLTLIMFGAVLWRRTGVVAQ
jgi:uncharacterized membrane protein